MKHLVKHFAKMGLLIAMAASLAACSDEPTATDIQKAAAQAMEMDIDRQIGGDHPELKNEIMSEMPKVNNVSLQGCEKQSAGAYHCEFTITLDFKGEKQDHDGSAVMTKDESGGWVMKDIK